ncbi:MAG: hypothetical protein RLZZ215_14 [Pseudomonadota bacterium]|jgi:predicted nucleic acid-binding protein
MNKHPKIFFDTNILVYAFDKDEPSKAAMARHWLREVGSQGNLVLSTQVLQEFYVAVTKSMNPKMPHLQAAELVNDFAEFPLVQVDKVLIAKAMQRHRNREFSFWDSLVIEAALQANCDTLLSEDMQDGRIIHGLTIVNPFKLKDKN